MFPEADIYSFFANNKDVENRNNNGDNDEEMDICTQVDLTIAYKHKVCIALCFICIFC